MMQLRVKRGCYDLNGAQSLVCSQRENRYFRSDGFIHNVTTITTAASGTAIAAAAACALR
jgi:hypothetical protein